MSMPANMIPTPRFDHLRQYMPEPGRTLLLKDTIFELPGAWKFFTRLSPQQAVFFYLPGFSAMPLSFARHVAHVDLFGLTPEEQELLGETAALKAISNIRCLQSIAEIQAPYATLVFMPARADSPSWQEMMAKLSAGANGAEEYWMLLHRPERGRMMHHGQKILRQLLRPKRETAAITPRFCFMATPAPATQVAELLPAAAHAEQLTFMLSPHFFAPRFISASGAATGVYAQVRSEKPVRAEHIVYGLRPARQASYFERLLLHLNRLSKRVWQPAGALRVLPGGKVQVVLHHHGSSRVEAALLKIPLISRAAARMRENALNLLRLAAAQELSPEQRGVFPNNLAEGQYEAQAYYLETFLSGGTLEHAPAEVGDAAQWQAIFQLWFEMQQRLARRIKVNEGVFAGVLGDLALRLQAWLSPAPHEAASLQRVVAYCKRVFFGRELTLGLVHGDFSIKNILVDAATRRVTGVIDWDLADFLSVPLLDVLHFFVRLDERSFRDPSPAIALRLTQSGQGLHAQYFGEACARFGYRHEDWPATVILYWLFRQRGYIGSDKNMDTKFVRRQFSDMLDLFEREVLSPRRGVVS